MAEKQNRRHCLIDDYPDELKEAIHRAIARKVKYKDITDMINKAGKKISLGTVGKYAKNFNDKLESIEIAKEQARALIETSAGLKMDLAEATTMASLQLLFNMLINTEDGEIDSNTLSAIKAAATLERSAVSRERLKMQYEDGVDSAAGKIKEQLSAELKGNPELMEQLNKIVDKASGEARKSQNKK